MHVHTGIKKIDMDIEWLKNQRLCIVNANDAQLYDEIVKCCESGLLRAAYILSWILLVESLRHKIETLANLGDRRAIQALENIEGVEKAEQANDKIIVDKAISCLVIDARYKSDLNYFWNQRCLYAHPYQTAPNDADVTLIITKALELVLKTGVHYHKDRIDEIVKNEVACFHIVPQNEPEQKERIRHHLLMVREEHYAFLYKTLFFEFSQAVDVKNIPLYRYLALFIELLVNETTFDINKDANGLQKQIANFPLMVWSLMYLAPSIWEKIDIAYRDSLFNCILLPSDNNFLYARCAYKLFVNGNTLTERYEQIYYDELGKHDINSSWSFYHNHSILLQRIDSEWVATCSYKTQEWYVDWLKSCFGNMSIFSSDEHEKLGNMFGKCCKNHTYVALDYLKSMPDEWNTYPRFKVGLVKGAYTLDTYLHIPMNCPVSVFKVFLNLSQEHQASVLSDLLQREVKTKSYDSEGRDALKKVIEENKNNITQATIDQLMVLLDKFYKEGSLRFEDMFSDN